MSTSPSRAYHHGALKTALLAALATRGFEQFGAALEDAARDESDPLAAMGLAYVRFALARPGRFRLMFGPGIADRSRFPELQAAAARAFERLAAGVRLGANIDRE